MNSDEHEDAVKSDFTAMGRDEYKLSRKAHPDLEFVDTSYDFDGLTPIVIEKKKPSKKRSRQDFHRRDGPEEFGYGSDSEDDSEGDDEKKGDEKKRAGGGNIVPPTLLHFEIVLEAYMGYNLSGGVNTVRDGNSGDDNSGDDSNDSGGEHSSTDPLVNFNIETMPSSIGEIIRLMDTLQPGREYYSRQEDSRGECSKIRKKLREYAQSDAEYLGVAHWVETKDWKPPSNEALSALMQLIREMIDESWPREGESEADDTDGDGVAYVESCFNSPDTFMPRSAVMGGAVVAALTSFQEDVVVQAFDNSDIFTESGNLKEESLYWPAKEALIKELHNYFLYNKRTPRERSPFSKGDTDIFLQASPLTQALLGVFQERGIGPDLLNIIGSYVGNSGRNSLCNSDLERYVDKAVGREGVIKAPSGESTSRWGGETEEEETRFAFAVSKNAVSFILGKDKAFDNGYNDNTFDDTTWPRASQFIMLDCQADLVGGLLDFDQSVAAMSYDGVSVRVAPRAALSLMTNANFVTPFCFEEHRNKRRVIKYSSRGFKPYLIDPNDSGPSQNVACDPVISRKPFLPKSVRFDYVESETWSAEDRWEVAGIQEAKMNAGNDRMFCCHLLGVDKQWRNNRNEKEGAFRKLGSDANEFYRGTLNVAYSMKMYEKSHDDAIDFFRQRFSYNEEELQEVKAIDPYLRVSCSKCKHEYELIRLVMAKYPDLMKEYDLEDDNLHGEFSYSHSNQQSQYVRFEPSFYSGGVFNSTHVRGNARRLLQILSMLHAQSIFEVSRYVLKHGSPAGYKKRFVYGSDLMKTLLKARRTKLQEPARPPIGLNPERFVERCEQCQSWLLGNTYGSKTCQRCNVNAN